MSFCFFFKVRFVENLEHFPSKAPGVQLLGILSSEKSAMGPTTLDIGLAHLQKAGYPLAS